MFIVYYISVTTVGTVATDWANDGVFGDGWHLFGIGAGEYEDVSGEFGDAANVIDAFVTAEGADDVADAIDTESDTFDAAATYNALLFIPAKAHQQPNLELPVTGIFSRRSSR